MGGGCAGGGGGGGECMMSTLSLYSLGQSFLVQVDLSLTKLLPWKVFLKKVWFPERASK